MQGSGFLIVVASGKWPGVPARAGSESRDSGPALSGEVREEGRPRAVTLPAVAGFQAHPGVPPHG